MELFYAISETIEELFANFLDNHKSNIESNSKTVLEAILNEVRKAEEGEKINLDDIQITIAEESLSEERSSEELLLEEHSSEISSDSSLQEENTGSAPKQPKPQTTTPSKESQASQSRQPKEQPREIVSKTKVTSAPDEAVAEITTLPRRVTTVSTSGTRTNSTLKTGTVFSLNPNSTSSHLDLISGASKSLGENTGDLTLELRQLRQKPIVIFKDKETTEAEAAGSPSRVGGGKKDAEVTEEAKKAFENIKTTLEEGVKQLEQSEQLKNVTKAIKKLMEEQKKSLEKLEEKVVDILKTKNVKLSEDKLKQYYKYIEQKQSKATTGTTGATGATNLLNKPNSPIALSEKKSDSKQQDRLLSSLPKGVEAPQFIRIGVAGSMLDEEQRKMIDELQSELNKIESTKEQEQSNQFSKKTTEQEREQKLKELEAQRGVLEQQRQQFQSKITEVSEKLQEDFSLHLAEGFTSLYRDVVGTLSKEIEEEKPKEKKEEVKVEGKKTRLLFEGIKQKQEKKQEEQELKQKEEKIEQMKEAALSICDSMYKGNGISIPEDLEEVLKQMQGAEEAKGAKTVVAIRTEAEKATPSKKDKSKEEKIEEEEKKEIAELYNRVRTECAKKELQYIPNRLYQYESGEQPPFRFQSEVEVGENNKTKKLILSGNDFLFKGQGTLTFVLPMNVSINNLVTDIRMYGLLNAIAVGGYQVNIKVGNKEEKGRAKKFVIPARGDLDSEKEIPSKEYPKDAIVLSIPGAGSSEEDNKQSGTKDSKQSGTKGYKYITDYGVEETEGKTEGEREGKTEGEREGERKSPVTIQKKSPDSSRDNDDEEEALNTINSFFRKSFKFSALGKKIDKEKSGPERLKEAAKLDLNHESAIGEHARRIQSEERVREGFVRPI